MEVSEEHMKWLWLEEQVSTLKARVRKLEETLPYLEKEECFTKLEGRISKLEGRISKLEERCQKLIVQTRELFVQIKRAFNVLRKLEIEEKVEKIQEKEEKRDFLVNLIIPPVMVKCPFCGSRAKVLSIPWEAYIECEVCGFVELSYLSDEWEQVLNQYLEVMTNFYESRLSNTSHVNDQ